MSFAILSLICSNDQRKRGIRVQYCMWAAWGWAWVGIYIMTRHMTYNDFQMYRQQCPDGKRKQHQFKKDYNETQPSYVKQTVAWGHRSGQRRMGTVKSKSSCTWCATSWSDHPAGAHEPSLTHYFLSLLNKKGKLLRCYTQNIDSLECMAGSTCPQGTLGNLGFFSIFLICNLESEFGLLDVQLHHEIASQSAAAAGGRRAVAGRSPTVGPLPLPSRWKVMVWGIKSSFISSMSTE